MKLSRLKINPRNPQKFDDLSILEKSINEFPKMFQYRPIVVDENFMVLGGNKRLICLQNLGFKTIPDEWVRKASDLTLDEQKRFIIADNVGFGEPDWNILHEDWDKEQLEDWGLFETKGFFQKLQENEGVDQETMKTPYPITIVVDFDDYIKWQELKDKHNETNDLRLFLKLLKKL